MSFKSYRVVSDGAGGCWLSDPRPVRFSGPHGRVALFVRGLQEKAEEAWLLPEPETGGEVRWTVFEAMEGSLLTLRRLVEVRGLCRSKTHLVMRFETLEVASAAPIGAAGVQVRPSVGARQWVEELTLDGGPGSGFCTWHWCEAPLQLGAVTL